MTEFGEGDKVKITQIGQTYGDPYVGKEGLIQKVSYSGNESLINYQVDVLDDNDMPIATLTLFENELVLIESAE